MRLAVFILALASPAAAQQFSLPAGCTAYLTVQDRSCQVDHHFTCKGDPAGHQRRASLSEEGLTYVGMIDDEAQWIQSFHVMARQSESLAPNPVDPASFTELLATGKDSYDFNTMSQEVGVTRYVGRDILTGNTVEIDGVTLDETAYHITAMTPDGTVIWSSRGNEFISRDWRMFLSGTGTTKTSSDTFDKDDRPVEFIHPGEPGFLSTKPKHGCGVMLSAIPSLQENAHDNL